MKADKLGQAELHLSVLATCKDDQEFTLNVADPKIEGSKGCVVIGLRWDTAGARKLLHFVEEPG
eukprot:1063831-Prymnesium_polylepis.1